MPNTTRKTAEKKSAPAKKAEAEAPKKDRAPQYREACKDEFATLKAAVQVVQRLGYRGPDSLVKWHRASDRPEGVDVPEDGTPMPEAMADAVVTARAALDALDEAVAAQAEEA